MVYETLAYSLILVTNHRLKTTGAPDPKARGTEIIDQEKVLRGAQPTAETEHHHTSEGDARTDDH